MRRLLRLRAPQRLDALVEKSGGVHLLLAAADARRRGEDRNDAQARGSRSACSRARVSKGSAIATTAVSPIRAHHQHPVPDRVDGGKRVRQRRRRPSGSRGLRPRCSTGRRAPPRRTARWRRHGPRAPRRAGGPPRGAAGARRGACGGRSSPPAGAGDPAERRGRRPRRCERAAPAGAPARGGAPGQRGPARRPAPRPPGGGSAAPRPGAAPPARNRGRTRRPGRWRREPTKGRNPTGVVAKLTLVTKGDSEGAGLACPDTVPPTAAGRPGGNREPEDDRHLGSGARCGCCRSSGGCRRRAPGRVSGGGTSGDLADGDGAAVGSGQGQRPAARVRRQCQGRPPGRSMS